MNVLGLVFSLMLLLSYAFFATWEKHSSSHRLRTTYLGHERAQRKILNRYESELYNRLRGHSSAASLVKEKKERKAKPLLYPKFNEECARLNLWNLVQEGREKYPILYEIALQLFTHLSEEKLTSHFLDAFLLCAKEQIQKKDSSLALEKFSFKEKSFQKLYYRLLKGSKERNIPPLLEYISLSPSDEKICLFHADIHLLTALFGSETASRLFKEMHQDHAPPLTQELMERICLEAHSPIFEETFFELFEMGRPSHKNSNKKTFVAEDGETQISLRKSLYLPS